MPKPKIKARAKAKVWSFTNHDSDKAPSGLSLFSRPVRRHKDNTQHAGYVVLDVRREPGWEINVDLSLAHAQALLVELTAAVARAQTIEICDSQNCYYCSRAKFDEGAKP